MINTREKVVSLGNRETELTYETIAAIGLISASLGSFLDFLSLADIQSTVVTKLEMLIKDWKNFVLDNPRVLDLSVLQGFAEKIKAVNEQFQVLYNNLLAEVEEKLKIPPYDLDQLKLLKNKILHLQAEYTAVLKTLFTVREYLIEDMTGWIQAREIPTQLEFPNSETIRRGLSLAYIEQQKDFWAVEQNFVAITHSVGMRFFATKGGRDNPELSDLIRSLPKMEDRKETAFHGAISPTHDSFFLTSVLVAAEFEGSRILPRIIGYGMAVFNAIGEPRSIEAVNCIGSEVDPCDLLEWYRRILTDFARPLPVGSVIKRFILVENFPGKIGDFLDSTLVPTTLNPSILETSNHETLLDSKIITKLYSGEIKLAGYSQQGIQTAVLDGLITYLKKAQKIDQLGWIIFDKPEDVQGILSISNGQLLLRIINVDLGSYSPKIARASKLSQAATTAGVPDILTPANMRNEPEKYNQEADFSKLLVILGLSKDQSKSDGSIQGLIDRLSKIKAVLSAE